MRGDGPAGEELRPLSSPRNPKTDSLGVGDSSDRPNGDTIVSGTPDMTPVVLPGSLPFAVPAALRALSFLRTPKLLPGRGYIAVHFLKLEFLENEASDRPGAKNKIDRVSISKKMAKTDFFYSHVRGRNSRKYGFFNTKRSIFLISADRTGPKNCVRS